MIKLLFNPFEKYSEKVLLIVGISASILGIFLGFSFNGFYEGVLDLKFYYSVNFSEMIFSLLINFFIIGLILYLLGIYINTKTRFIDILSSILIARIPTYILTFSNYNGFMFKIGEEVNNNLIDLTNLNFSVNLILKLIFVSIIGIFILIWTLSLLYNGFKIASNLKSNKHVFLFIVSIIIAEIISKILISNLL